jgi:hypothetical protein
VRNRRALRTLALAGTLALALLQAGPLGAQAPQQPAPGQPSQEGQNGPGRRRREPNPEREAQRAALLAACGADLQKLCAGKEGRERFQCLREHRAELSAPCGTELEKRRERRRGQGQDQGEDAQPQ